MNLIDLYYAAESYFFRSISEKYLNLDNGIDAYLTGVPISDLNMVYIQNSPQNLNDILIKSEQFFAQANLDFTVILKEKFCFPEAQDILQKRGYLQKDTCTSMVLKLDASIRNRNQ